MTEEKKGKILTVHNPNGRHYYLHENTDVRDFFDQENINCKAEIRKHILINQYNNRIGAYQFKDESGIYLKIIIMPKTILSTEKEAEQKQEVKLQQEFCKYLAKYNSLKKTGSGVAEITDNVVDFEIDNIETIDDYFEEKYKEALKSILAFFKKHKSVNVVSNEYVDSSFNDRLNIKRSVLEPNKSRIHQIRDIEVSYSELANITKACLLHFDKYTIPLLNPSKNTSATDLSVKDHCLSLDRVISKSFTIKSFKFSPSFMLKSRVKKLFYKNRQTKTLFNNLLVLLGSDVFNDSATKVECMLSVFYNPAKMFELHVHNVLSSTLANHGFSIYEQEEFLTPLLQVSNDKKKDGLSGHKAVPDHIFLNDTIAFVLDSKWKNLDDFIGIKQPDIFKLMRDKKVLHKQGLENKESGERRYFEKSKIKPILIYPHVDKDIKQGEEYYFDYARDDLFSIYSFPIFDDPILNKSIELLTRKATT
jgi:hypothetical protein